MAKRKTKATTQHDLDLAPAKKIRRSKKQKSEEPIDIPPDQEADELAVRNSKKVSDDEARRRWPNRYEDNSVVMAAKCHYYNAEVDGTIFSLGDDVIVKGEPDNFIGKIIEIFRGEDDSINFTSQWFYRVTDTVIKDSCSLIDGHCIFYSELKDENPINCLIKRISVVSSKEDFDARKDLQSPPDFYCNQLYDPNFTSFLNLPSGMSGEANISISRSKPDSVISRKPDAAQLCPSKGESSNRERVALDLYAGCGAMSTGLCLGANSSGVKLTTKWAVDINKAACKSFQRNHPETKVRCVAAESFLSLIKEWDTFCLNILSEDKGTSKVDGDDDEGNEDEEDNNSDGEIYVVDEILGVDFGIADGHESPELLFQIHWEGYDTDEDTWEPFSSLSGCPEKVKDFVSRNYKNILPAPDSVDVICGGPPCQGISGYNRFRNSEEPLEDEKNKQLLTYLEIVSFLRPKFVLMENVPDILKFAGGFLGRYAMGSFVSMGYQVRTGLLAAGCYGLPQYRFRMFMWAALPTERLPQYPLPTHKLAVKGNVPLEFEANAVRYDEAGLDMHLKDSIFLIDAISDLPEIGNDEDRNVMPYISEPKTDFQRFIRLGRNAMHGALPNPKETAELKLSDHRPLKMNVDDYTRACLIPFRKGACFRDLPGVMVHNKKVMFKPHMKRRMLPSGKPLVPDYAMTYQNAASKKPFGRVWWDEMVPTVITRAKPHNHRILHPSQNRVLSIRENARIQGFPDQYRLYGSPKERYIQVGNAVAVPVARALGYCLGLSLEGVSGNEPLYTLPPNYLPVITQNVPVDGDEHMKNTEEEPKGETEDDDTIQLLHQIL